MTKKDKHLLLVDLCARLPYGVKCREFKLDSQICTLTADLLDKDKVDNLEPYLRPMSSMTEEDEREVRILWHEDFVNKISLYNCYPKTTDFYNKNHFDYRGLIEMGLALEAPEGMYSV